MSISEEYISTKLKKKCIFEISCLPARGTRYFITLNNCEFGAIFSLHNSQLTNLKLKLKHFASFFQFEHFKVSTLLKPS